MQQPSYMKMEGGMKEEKYFDIYLTQGKTPIERPHSVIHINNIP